MENRTSTDFLFARASFLTGVASAINVAGNFYHFNHSSSGEEADIKAIKCDMMMVGRDLEIAFEKESGNSIKSSIIHEYATK